MQKELKIWTTMDYSVCQKADAIDRQDELPFIHIKFPDGNMICMTLGLADKLGEISAQARVKYGKVIKS